MTTILKDGNVLHIVFTRPTGQIYDEIVKLADEYEGVIKNRIGVNFPLHSKHPIHKKYIDKYGEISYLIMYKKGDVSTKRHELQHARYYLDPMFRQEVKTLWDGLKPLTKTNILGMLKKMGYPDNYNILLDEFQAYYFTEKPNFFGKLT